MSTSVTIGTLAASALSIGASALIKGAATEAVKDAYNALKRRIQLCAKDDVVALETEPDSNGRKAVIAEVIDRQSSEELEVIRDLSKVLTERIVDCGAIGIDIGNVSALNVRLSDISVIEGVGVRIEEAKVEANLEISGVTAGKKPGNYKG